MYQGRYKSFPVEEDAHFLAVARYVERNALRANLVCGAEEWRGRVLWRRCSGNGRGKVVLRPGHGDAAGLDRRVNQADNEQELEALRRSVRRGRPYGTPEWQKRIAKRLGLESSYRSAGRPARRRRELPGRRVTEPRLSSHLPNIGPVPFSAQQIAWATANGTAVAPGDYTALTGR